MNFFSSESQCFPRQSREKHWNLREKNSLFPKGPVTKWFVIWQNKTKANFEKRTQIPSTSSGHLQLHSLIMCNRVQHFTCSSELFPKWHHSFRGADCWQHCKNYGWHLEVNRLFFLISCDRELANEWACCSRINVTYITWLDISLNRGGNVR